MFIDPEIKPLVAQIKARIEAIRRTLSFRYFVDGVPDEALQLELDILNKTLEIYTMLGMVKCDI